MNVSGSHPSPRIEAPARLAWSFFSTPFRVFAGVLGPIAGMMLLLAVMPGVPTGLRITAAAVVVVSLFALYRGYGHWIEATPDGVCFRRLGRRLRLRWHEVRRIGRYIPLDRNRTCPYVYITRLEEPPRDWREIDENTIQLQDRPGLLDALQEQWENSNCRGKVMHHANKERNQGIG